MPKIYILPGDLVHAVDWAVVWDTVSISQKNTWDPLKSNKRPVDPGEIGLAVAVEYIPVRGEYYPSVYCVFSDVIGWTEFYADQISNINEELSEEALEYLAEHKP